MFQCTNSRIICVMMLMLCVMGIYLVEVNNSLDLSDITPANSMFRTLFSDSREGELDMNLALWGLPLKGKAPKYLSNYRNPCWYDPSSHNGTLSCLPYFYLLGVTKCGTSSFFRNIMKHPDVYAGRNKELHFWDYNNKRPDLYSEYVANFKDATLSIESNNDIAGYHHGITFDGTPSYFANIMKGGIQITGNWDAMKSEPKYTIAHTLYAVNPNTKLLVMLRNPTERIFSHYHMWLKVGFTPRAVHKHVAPKIKAMTSCLSQRSLRSCILDNQWGMLTNGMYYPMAIEWLSVFPRKQIMFIKSEDWYINSTRVAAEIFDHLGLRDPGDGVYEAIQDQMVAHRSSSKYHTPTAQKMWNKTRRLLDDFYRPYNVKLSKLLGDQRFLFN